MCRAKLTSLVGADSDHVMDTSGIEGYPSVHDGYQFAILVLCAKRPRLYNVYAQFTPSNWPLQQQVASDTVVLTRCTVEYKVYPLDEVHTLQNLELNGTFETRPR